MVWRVRLGRVGNRVICGDFQSIPINSNQFQSIPITFEKMMSGWIYDMRFTIYMPQLRRMVADHSSKLVREKFRRVKPHQGSSRLIKVA